MKTEELKQDERNAALDPGYLMLAMYVLSVTVLVLFGWFGSADAAGRGGAQDRIEALMNKAAVGNEIRQPEPLLYVGSALSACGAVPAQMPAGCRGRQ